MNTYHTPVMESKSIDYLQPERGGIFVDATLGGGGHSLAILQTGEKVQLFGFDQDEEAVMTASQRLEAYKSQVTIIHENFSSLRTQLAYHKIKHIDGILFDLGVSSHQLDDKSRGFSFSSNDALDMRMDKRMEQTAADLLNNLTATQLCRIFREYGEELHAKRIANAIEAIREKSPIQTTKELSDIVDNVLSGNPKEIIKSKARIFQSLRIYLNDEMNVLNTALKDAINLLAPGGRIVVLSYHSLEDRCVKQLFKTASSGCICDPRAMKCTCNQKKLLKVITPKPILADEQEIIQNSRARSAKLRAAEKIRRQNER